MRAIIIKQFGGLDGLVIENLPDPVPQPGSVLIEVKAFGINHAVNDFNPLLQMPSGVYFTFFGGFVFGTPDFPVSDVPLQAIVDKAAAGIYKAKPARVFQFDEIREAHEAMESDQAHFGQRLRQLGQMKVCFQNGGFQYAS
jgi:NADPH:quinone reductase-like Zn-dependent oxidoreductase